MTKTKLLLAGLLAGAVASGAACKTDKGTTSGTDQTTPSAPDTVDAGTGGAGFGEPDSGQGVRPLPEEGTREMEPDVHEGTHEEPGTGGTGLEDTPLGETRDLGEETGQEPDSPGAPTNQPVPEDEIHHHDEGMDEPRQ